MDKEKSEKLIKEFLRDNKDAIINYYSKTDDLTVLNSMLDNLNSVNLVNPELEELKNVVNNRVHELQNINNVEQEIQSIKDNNVIDNIKVILTEKDINNKDYYGFRNNTYYLKINIMNEERIFEINNEYIDKIKNILEDENNKNKSIEDILDYLYPYINELKKIDMDVNTNLDKEGIKKELESISDTKTKEEFLKNISDVLNERTKVNSYIKDNNIKDAKLSYSINSKGERLYNVNGIIIKFVDNDDMYILEENSSEFINANDIMDTTKTEHNKIEENVDRNVDDIPNSLYDLDTEYYINAINFALDKIYFNEKLDYYEEKLIEMFFSLCLLNKEEDIPTNLYEIYDKYYNYLLETGNYYNERIKELFNFKVTVNKQGNVKKLELKDNNSNKVGFVDITLIVCVIIVIIISILYLLLVKY